MIAINKIIIFELMIVNKYAPGKINNEEKIKKYFVSLIIFLKFPPLLNWYKLTTSVGIKISAIIIFTSKTNDKSEIETVGIPNPILPFITPQSTYTKKMYVRIVSGYVEMIINVDFTMIF